MARKCSAGHPPHRHFDRAERVEKSDAEVSRRRAGRISPLRSAAPRAAPVDMTERRCGGRNRREIT